MKKYLLNNIFIEDGTIYINRGSESRLDLIDFIVKTIKANSYLEIGCYENYVFDKINVKTKVGVDPYRGGNCRMTSDKFFSTNTQTFDVIFIDGDHEYDQVHRDVYNSLKFLNKNGVIVLHDVLPESEASTISDNHGTVYRINLDLQKEKNLLYKIVNIDCGCGVILPGRQNTKVLKMKRKVMDNWNDYVKYFYKLPIISYQEFKELLISIQRKNPGETK